MMVKLWRDSFKGWRLLCSECGPLGDFGTYWPAQRAAEAHEDIHRDEPDGQTERPPDSGGPLDVGAGEPLT